MDNLVVVLVVFVDVVEAARLGRETRSLASSLIPCRSRFEATSPQAATDQQDKVKRRKGEKIAVGKIG